MTAAAEVLAVTLAEDGETSCRRCQRPIRRGQRIVLLASVGNVHLTCVLVRQGDDAGQEQAR